MPFHGRVSFTSCSVGCRQETGNRLPDSFRRLCLGIWERNLISLRSFGPWHLDGCNQSLLHAHASVSVHIQHERITEASEQNHKDDDKIKHASWKIFHLPKAFQRQKESERKVIYFKLSLDECQSWLSKGGKRNNFKAYYLAYYCYGYQKWQHFNFFTLNRPEAKKELLLSQEGKKIELSGE